VAEKESLKLTAWTEKFKCSFYENYDQMILVQLPP